MILIQDCLDFNVTVLCLIQKSPQYNKEWMVFVHRWYLFTDGDCLQMVSVYRWSLFVDGVCLQMVSVYRWCLYTDGVCSWVIKSKNTYL